MSIFHFLRHGCSRKARIEAEVFIVSFPKCGRTWLRVMLSKAVALHFDLTGGEDITDIFSKDSRIPRIKMTHDGSDKVPCDMLPSDKSRYEGKKVILLVRDIRDTIVSAYFQYTQRMVLSRNEKNKKFAQHIVNSVHGISDFIRFPIGSTDSFIRFYNTWAEKQHVPSQLLLVRYEDMIEEPSRELRRVLEFLDIGEVRQKTIDDAVEYGNFSKMSKNEHAKRQGKSEAPVNPESYKVRRGKVHGYGDYLNEEDIEVLTRRLEELSPFYGYSK